MDRDNRFSSFAEYTSHPLVRYGLVGLLVGVTLAVRVILWPVLGDAASFLFFFLPILFSSWFFGRAAGVLATALSAIAVEAVLLPSPGLPPSDGILHFLFIWSGVLVSLFVSEKRQTEQKLLVLNSELERRVAERTHELQKEVEQRRSGELMLHRQAQLLQLTHDAILVRGFHSTRILFWNKGAEKLYGWTESEALGKNCHELLQTKFPQPREQIQATVSKTGSWEGELIQTTSEGRQVIVASRWYLRPVERGEPAAFLEIYSDITGKREAEQTAREKEHLASIGTAAAIFAHEVSNPLSALSTALQLLRGNAQRIPQDSTLLLDQAFEEVRRLELLLKEFRDLARPQSLNKTPVDVSNIIEDIVTLQHPLCESAGITLQLQLEPLPRLMLDTAKIRQAVVNIFKNAVEAMPDGGSLTIRTLVCGGKQVKLEISDTGPGIPEGTKVFESFVTTKPGGLGLGLPIVQAIIAAHSGKVEYTSQPGQGTTFTITLPMVEKMVTSEQPESATPMTTH